VEDIEKRCKTLDQLCSSKAWSEALEAAAELWQVSQDAVIEPSMRVTYARALYKVADLREYKAADPYQATVVLRRAYEFADDENRLDLSTPSLREGIAYRLGLSFQTAKCHRSAVFWFRRSLGLVRGRPNQNQLLLNLYGVAWNFELLQLPREAGPLYDEMRALLWPITDYNLLQERLRFLLPLAMYQIYHGDCSLGETIMRSLLRVLDTPGVPLPAYFAGGIGGLGNHYLAQGRHDDATRLADSVLPNVQRFGENAAELRDLLYGLAARAAAQRGDFDSALVEIGKVFNLDPSSELVYGPETSIDKLELWRDVARIRAHLGDLVGSAKAYQTLAQALGVYAADWRNGKTARLRLAFIQQQADVVHELVSVWLSIDDPSIKRSIETAVANALLQLKSNQFLANEGNRLVTFRDYEGVDKSNFALNRRFAAAARRFLADPQNIDIALELEDALFAREQLESWMVANAFEMMPVAAEVFHYDFRDLNSVKYGKQTVLDYTLVEFRPPSRGLSGPKLGRRYVGVRLSSDGIRIDSLGTDDQVDELTVALVAELAKRPAANSASIVSNPIEGKDRNLIVAANFGASPRSLSELTDELYQTILKPLEPLGNSLVIAPDGSLAALPFHALMRNDRYLIEDLEVSYCHSLLQEEALAYRQSVPGMQLSIDTAGVSREVVLLGDPDYSDGSALPLPGTKDEVEEIAQLFLAHGYSKDEVHPFIGPDATASRVVGVDHPRVLHVAAHGSYLAAATASAMASTPVDGYKSWRKWEDLGAAALSNLDVSLLRAVLVLASQSDSHDDPSAGRLLTALELSSLNLIACRLIALSACETGLGQVDRGAGVLGFQYAILASFAHAGLVSLWSVPDRETSDWMRKLYQRLVDSNWQVRPAYLATLRETCRANGRVVHPYYWAAFALMGSINR
jgi:CHAT domain-containing protein